MKNNNISSGLGYWAIFSNPAVQLQVCHNKAEFEFWVFHDEVHHSLQDSAELL